MHLRMHTCFPMARYDRIYFVDGRCTLNIRMSSCYPHLLQSPLLYRLPGSSTPVVGTCYISFDIFQGCVWLRGGTSFSALSQIPPSRVAPFPLTLSRTGINPPLAYCSTERSLVSNWLVRLRFCLSWVLRWNSGGRVRVLDLVLAVHSYRTLDAMKSSDWLRAETPCVARQRLVPRLSRRPTRSASFLHYAFPDTTRWNGPMYDLCYGSCCD